VFQDFKGLQNLQEICCLQMGKYGNFNKRNMIIFHKVMFGNGAMGLIQKNNNGENIVNF
jgi:hypothetical protein